MIANDALPRPISFSLDVKIIVSVIVELAPCSLSSGIGPTPATQEEELFKACRVIRETLKEL